MNGFTKLFATLVTSTIWRENDKTRVVWITMLALADRDGYVAASIPGLAAMANVGVEECREAIERLKAPDDDSRTKTNQGRRIVDSDGGWNLLNYSKYRELGRSVDRSEYLRLAQQKSRAKRKGQPTSTNVNPDQPIAEAEAEDRSELISESIALADSAPPVLVFPTSGTIRQWRLTQYQVSRWVELFPGVEVLAECRKALAWVEATPSKRKTVGGMPRFLAGWLGRQQNAAAKATGSTVTVRSWTPPPSRPAPYHKPAQSIPGLREWATDLSTKKGAP